MVNIKEPVNHILIIKLSAIGDVVHALPVLEVLRENYPRATIDWVVEEAASGIIEGHPAVDSVISSRRKSWQKQFLKNGGRLKGVMEAGAFLKALRGRRYDLVIDLQGLFKSGIIAGLVQGTRKVGMAGAREGAWLFWNERPASVNYDQHAIERYLEFIRKLDCRVRRWKGRIPVSGPERAAAEALLESEGLDSGTIVAVNPMAGWESKLWEPHRIAALADKLYNELSCNVVFTGSVRDRPAIGKITELMESPAVNLAGRTNLKTLAFFYSQCRVLVCPDTGPMHIAVAMGCPVVALFGPTAPRRTGPYGRGHTVLRADMDCSPCFKRRCRHKACMSEITVEQAFKAVEDQLAEKEV